MVLLHGMFRSQLEQGKQTLLMKGFSLIFFRSFNVYVKFWGFPWIFFFRMSGLAQQMSSSILYFLCSFSLRLLLLLTFSRGTLMSFDCFNRFFIWRTHYQKKESVGFEDEKRDKRLRSWIYLCIEMSEGGETSTVYIKCLHLANFLAISKDSCFTIGNGV